MLESQRLKRLRF